MIVSNSLSLSSYFSVNIKLSRLLVVTAFVWSILTFISPTRAYDQLLHRVTGKVGAGNYSYYRIQRKEPLLIELDSTQGDADIYVLSSSNDQATYENYDLNSATCGADVVEVGSEVKRPISIGIFGHSSHEHSVYNLQVFVDTSVREPNSKREKSKQSPSGKVQEEEESLLMSLFVGIIKILIDVLI